MLAQQVVFSRAGRVGERRAGPRMRILYNSLFAGFDKLGLDIARDQQGFVDLPENLRKIQGLGLDPTEMSKIFTRRGATAITQQIAGIGFLEGGGIGDFMGTAMENAMEHSETYANSLKKFTARSETLSAELGEGAIQARQFWMDLATISFDEVIKWTEKYPNLLKNAGKVMQTAGAAGGVAGGVLETAVGVHAFSQLLGIQRPLRRSLLATGRGIRGLFRLLMRGGPAPDGSSTRYRTAVR